MGGENCDVLSLQALYPAHPRVGGENQLGKRRVEGVQDSSPRGRGKPCVRVCDGCACGLIPAWAGKTGPESTSA